jgi:hypothetical protein
MLRIYEAVILRDFFVKTLGKIMQIIWLEKVKKMECFPDFCNLLNLYCILSHTHSLFSSQEEHPRLAGRRRK